MVYLFSSFEHFLSKNWLLWPNFIGIIAHSGLVCSYQLFDIQEILVRKCISLIYVTGLRVKDFGIPSEYYVADYRRMLVHFYL